MVQEATGRRHEDVRTLAQAPDLSVHVGTAHERRRKDAPASAQLGDRLLDLDGQLPRRGQDQAARMAVGRPGQPFDHRNHEGRGLARAGLRAAEHVAPGEPGRDGLGLDGRRLMEPRLVEVM